MGRIWLTWRVRVSTATVLVCLGLGWSINVEGGEGGGLLQLDIEDLMDLPVVMVSRREVSLFDSAAAVYVITGDDIRRGGFTQLPDALRLVPGMQVSQIGSGLWAVSMRGFQGQYADRLLVLMDGRCVYNPIFSGVFWEVQDTVFEDIDRIEVVGGPGGALWGANAVNGIINIITKGASDTQGLLLSAGGGNLDHSVFEARYGGRIADKAYYRIYAKSVERDELEMGGGDAGDFWRIGRGGFRVDWDATGRDHLTLQGDAYDGSMDYQFMVPSTRPPFLGLTPDERHDSYGFNLLSRWKSNLGEDSDFTFQTYYDSAHEEYGGMVVSYDTLDADLQHTLRLGQRNDFMWGAAGRFVSSRLAGFEGLMLDPERRDTIRYDAFIQDGVKFVDGKIRLTVGTKVEHNDYSGVEYQPNVRLLWSPVPNHAVWTAVSRAVRTPDRLATDVHMMFRLTPSPFADGRYMVDIGNGNENVESEKMTACEIGYRFRAGAHFSVNTTAFGQIHRGLLVGVVSGPPYLESPSSAYWIRPYQWQNAEDIDTYGVEVAVHWLPVQGCSLYATYSWLKKDASDGVGLIGANDEPEHRASARMQLDLPSRVELDTMVYYVSQCVARDYTFFDVGEIPAYTRVDVRLGKRIGANLELSVVGRNLFDPEHQEHSVALFGVSPEEVPRSVYAQVTLRF